jgi:hypothetical protein
MVSQEAMPVADLGLNISIKKIEGLCKGVTELFEASSIASHSKGNLLMLVRVKQHEKFSTGVSP